MENSTVLNSLKPPFIVICYYAYLHFLSSAIFLYVPSMLYRLIVVTHTHTHAKYRYRNFGADEEKEIEQTCAWVSILIECVFKASKSHKYKKTIQDKTHIQTKS